MRINNAQEFVRSGQTIPRITLGNLLLVGAVLGLALAVGLLVHEPKTDAVAQEPEKLLTTLAAPASLAAGPRGTVYAVDQISGQVLCIYPDGEQTVLGNPVANPSALAVDPMGTVFVYSRADQTIYAITPDGRSRVVASGLPQVTDLAATHYGNLVIAGSDGSIRQIRFDRF